METEERPYSKSKRIFFAPLIGFNRVTGWLLNKIFVNSGESTEDAILSMVDEGSERGFIEDTSAEIITNAFEFYHLEASDVMTHRVNVVGISADAELDDIVYIALEKGFSRLPVYRENLDDIIGIIIVKDLLSLIGKTDLSNFSIEDFLREAVYIPQSGSCTGLFKMLKEKKAGMAVVVDEYGGTAGIVTMEDLVEEIMGSILDEYDVEKVSIKKIGDEKYAIDGETDPDEALELFDCRLPDNHEYETVAGFVTDLLGYIPEQSRIEAGQVPRVDYEGLRFIVTGMEDNCISRVIMFRSGEEQEKKIARFQKS